ncbi:hypothetical protein B0H16DRAFT_1703867 [Mycena metata]|uniref:Uncharacterized protein n=1 Tax=Mycena metata TaxID=1033252 RepID=A0AAD7H072_9AGAR|nr:hypothetical protein B0H16DRAFT_1703867 [Mycena metata]
MALMAPRSQTPRPSSLSAVSGRPSTGCHSPELDVRVRKVSLYAFLLTYVLGENPLQLTPTSPSRRIPLDIGMGGVGTASICTTDAPHLRWKMMAGIWGPAQDDQGSVLGTRDAEGTTIEASDGARGGMGATGDEHQGSGDGRERERWKRRLPKAVHQLRRVVTTASTEVTALPPPSPPSSLPVAAAIVAADYDGSAAAIKPSPHHIAHQ